MKLSNTLQHTIFKWNFRQFIVFDLNRFCRITSLIYIDEYLLEFSFNNCVDLCSTSGAIFRTEQ